MRNIYQLFITSVIFIIGQILCVNAALANNNASQPNTLANVPLSELPVLYSAGGNTVAGNSHGQITIVEFFDYNCGSCRSMKLIVDNVIKSHPNVRVVYKDLAILSPASYPPAQAALAAQKQGKYLQMHNALMTSNRPLTIREIDRLASNLHLNVYRLNRDMNNPAILRQLQDNRVLSNQIGLEYTPVFVVGPSSLASAPQHGTAQSVLQGPQSFREFHEVISDISRNNQIS